MSDFAGEHGQWPDAGADRRKEPEQSEERRLMGRLAQISISPGGVPKKRVIEAVIGVNGIVGDGVDHPAIHGGPDRAVCLYSLELIAALASEGHPIAPGTTGENLTLAGVDWSAVRPGARIKIGNAVELEVVKFTTPCKTIAGSFRNGEYSRILEDRHRGWSRVYARVLSAGTIRENDPVTIIVPD